MTLEQELRSGLGEDPQENMDFLVKLMSNVTDNESLRNNLEIGVQGAYKIYIYSKLLYQEALKVRKLRMMSKEKASAIRDNFYSQRKIIETLSKTLNANFPL